MPECPPDVHLILHEIELLSAQMDRLSRTATALLGRDVDGETGVPARPARPGSLVDGESAGSSANRRHPGHASLAFSKTSLD